MGTQWQKDILQNWNKKSADKLRSKVSQVGAGQGGEREGLKSGEMDRDSAE